MEDDETTDLVDLAFDQHKIILPPLTERQLRFCLAYIGEGRSNASQAARLAGYDEKWAKAQAYKLLRRDDIQTWLGWLSQTDPLLSNSDLLASLAGRIALGIKHPDLAKPPTYRDQLQAMEFIAKLKGMLKTRIEVDKRVQQVNAIIEVDPKNLSMDELSQTAQKLLKGDG